MIIYGRDDMSVDYTLLGRNIKRYRKMADLTQEQLANMTGYTDSHIGQIENAYGIPSYEAVCNIANALNVTMDQLSYGNINNTDDYFFQELKRITAEFDDKQKRFAIDMILSLMEQLKKHFEEERK